MSDNRKYPAYLYAKSASPKEAKGEGWKEWCHKDLEKERGWLLKVAHSFILKPRRESIAPVVMGAVHNGQAYWMMFADDGRDNEGRCCKRVIICAVPKVDLESLGKADVDCEFDAAENVATLRVRDESAASARAARIPFIKCETADAFEFDKKVLSENGKDVATVEYGCEAQERRADVCETFGTSARQNMGKMNHQNGTGHGFRKLGVVMLWVCLLASIGGNIYLLFESANTQERNKDLSERNASLNDRLQTERGKRQTLEEREREFDKSKEEFYQKMCDTVLTGIECLHTWEEGWSEVKDKITNRIDELDGKKGKEF